MERIVVLMSMLLSQMAKSDRSKDPTQVLAAQEREKKKKHLEAFEACLEQRHRFTPFVASTDGLFGRDAEILLQKLSTFLSLRNGRSLTPYVNARRMSIAIVRATHLCLRLSNPNQPDEPSSAVGGHRRPQPLPPLSPAQVALGLHDFGQDRANVLCDLAITSQITDGLL
jgi:hypothetical protein